MATSLTQTPIAIVGCAVRLPGEVHSLDQLWELLAARRDAINEDATKRWDPRYFYLESDAGSGSLLQRRRRAREHPGTIYTKAGGFLAEIDQFDADFFGIGAREASRMDPQHRLLLELAWEALEDAGERPSRLRGLPVGVFVGLSSTEYISLQYDDPATVNPYTNSGGAIGMASNRISYAFDFRGPSFTLDTACSSAMVALHQACASLWRGESVLALAGGANMMVKPAVTIGLCQASMLSPTGRCHSFDAAADGYVRGEGGGLFVLKPLARAEADGDRIHAVIRGAAVNSDGATLGISLPSEQAQVELLERAYREAGIDPLAVRYVEAHGTGTPAGDPIECAALGRVIGRNRPAGAPCYIGSIKSNIGHLESGSGAAGLAKVLAALHHRALPPNLHFDTPNPAIDFERLGLKVVAEMIPLADRGKLLMGVNSFGFGGTNAHLIVEEYRAPEAAAPEPAPPAPLMLSARSEAGLEELARAHAARTPESGPTYDEVYTAAVRRDHHGHRMAVCGADRHVVAGKAQARPKTAFLFSGNGTQHWGMARRLIEDDAEFRASVERADAAFAPLAGWSLMEEFLAPEPESRLARTEVAQPLLFALQIGLVDWLKRRGIEPDAVAGHSVGDVVAAWAAGVVTEAQAMRIVWARSRTQETTAGKGGMAAIGLSADEIRPWLTEDLELAGVNSAHAVTVTGARPALESLVSDLEALGTFARLLAVDYPFHSKLLDGLEAEFLGALGPLAPRSARIPFVSTVTGAEEEGATLDGRYWWANMRRPVRFAEAVGRLLAQGVRAFVEIGPEPALVAYVQECAREDAAEVRAFATLTRKRPDQDSLQRLLGNLYISGVLTDMERLFPRPGRVVALPLYPWQRKRYWNAPREGTVAAAAPKAEHPLLGHRVPGADRIWKNTLEIPFLPFLAGHVIDRAVVFPAAGHLEMALAAARAAGGGYPFEIEDLDIPRPLVLAEDQPVQTQFSVTEEDRVFRMQAKSGPEGSAEWRLQATGKAVRSPSAPPPHDGSSPEFDRVVQSAEFYEGAAARGLQYGPEFQLLAEVRAGRGVAEGHIQAPPHGPYLFHPAALDACLQTLAALDGEGASRLFVPVHLDRCRLFAPPALELTCRVQLRTATNWTILADFRILDGAGALVALLEGVRFRAVERPGAGKEPAVVCERRWIEQPLEKADRDDAPTGLFLLIGEDAELRGRLAAALRALGQDALETAPAAQEGLRALFTRLTGQGRECRGVVSLAGDTASATTVIQACADLPWAAPPQVWLVTRNAWRAPAENQPTEPWQACAWGVGRVAANEHPELRCRMVDLHGAAAGALARELVNPSEEDEILLDDDARYVARFAGTTSAELSLRGKPNSSEGPARLELATHGSLESLVLRRFRGPEPGPEQVRLRVHAAGLNFRDVMWALGLLPAEALEDGFAGASLGIECAGEVEAVGPGVTELRPGDRVMAFGSSCFATAVAAPARAARKIPEWMSFEEAATIPVVFLTAWYSLVHLARLEAGERVLIHGAAGGVGMAAIQIARLRGAEIFATAGTSEKRAWLREAGVPHVFDSRSPDFAGEARQAAPEGLDVVLNSLTGEAMERSLGLLGPFGRFVEIGKRDIYANHRLGLRSFRDNISYFAVDADQLLVHRGTLAGRLMEEVGALIDQRVLTPLPHRAWPAARAAEAFRTMQQSRHMGKIVLRFRNAGVEGDAAPPQCLELREDAAYLVTGGCGGFGLATAEWLAAKGARHLVLLGRRGAQTPGCREAIARLEAGGTRVRAVACDVTDQAALEAVFAGVRRDGLPVAGVVHAAMVMDDAPIAHTDPARLERVLAPKAKGAWNLHRQTLDLPLDFFVLYSSVSGMIGNAHQPAYAAANLFLEALAEHRRGLGLTALAVAWGAIGETGYLARNPELRALMEAGAGVRILPPREAFGVLEQLILAGAECACYAPLDWDRWRANAPAGTLPKYQALAPASADGASGQDGARSRIPDGLTPAQQREWLTSRLAGHLGRVLGLPPDDIDVQRPLATMGLDSLSAAELHVAVESDTGVDLPLMRLVGENNLEGIVEWILRKESGK